MALSKRIRRVTRFLPLVVAALLLTTCIHQRREPPPPPPPDDTPDAAVEPPRRTMEPPRRVLDIPRDAAVPPRERVRRPPPPPPPPPPRRAVCGNRKVERGEQCEARVRMRRTCKSFGYLKGKLRCKRCRYDFSRCVRRPVRIYRRGRGSCPYVYLWDGRRFTYQGDTSGSVLGYGLKFFKTAYYGDNIYKLGGFRAVRGQYRMKLREVIFESSFVDKVALLLVDAPKGYQVHTKWSFTSQLNRKPDLGFVTVRNPRKPISAKLADGTSVLAQVSKADGIPLPVKKNQRSRVIVKFGKIRNPKHAKLVVTTWGFYGDLRKHQRPPYSSGTVIEARDRRGRWKVIKTAGKSAGDAKTWAIDLGGLLRKTNTELRITMAHLPSVLDVLDAVALDDSPPVKIKVTRVYPTVAKLAYGGATVLTPSSLKNRILARDVKRPLVPEAYMKGRFTRFGNVRPLLGKSDDRFVIMGHGDTLHLRFKDAPKARGQSRQVFLLADLMYSLKYHPYGLLTKSATPLPFHGMKSYPYKPKDWPYRNDPGYARYRKKWNTRVHR